MTGKKATRLVSILVSIMLVFGALILPIGNVSKTYAAVDASDIKTWGALKTAIEVDGATDITITGAVFADSTITVTSPVTIHGDAETRTIYQKKRSNPASDNYLTMFVVSTNGDLTLGNNLTLSGKIGGCNAQAQKSYSDIQTTVTPATHTLNEFQKNEEPNVTLDDFVVEQTLGLMSGSNYLANDSAGYVGLGTSATGASAVSDLNGITMSFGPSSTAGIYTTSGSPAVTFLKSDGSPTSKIEKDGTYVISDQGNYLRGVSGGFNWATDSDINNAMVFTGFVKSTTWEVTGGTRTTDENIANNDLATYKTNNTVTYWEIPAGGTRYDDYNSANNALTQYNQDNGTTKYTFEGTAYSTEEEAKAAVDAYNASHQGCDGDPTVECANITPADDDGIYPTYRTETFPGAPLGDHKGFFVQVQDGGKATLDGATLENFLTSNRKGNSPKHIAPVVAKGTGSIFDIKSGEIKNNIVGYVIGPNWIDGDKSADEIKKYIKGAAPNAARKNDEYSYANSSYRRRVAAGIDQGAPASGVTGTAGAVIYANGAKGTVNGGEITFNRGDTGGIMATGEGTVVTLNAGTDINNNVGVQFGGGVTTENGASVIMNAGTISENVAWFGGGGVYATENGVLWLFGKQDIGSRKDGKFAMFGGTIEGNTAFTRGGGILVDSDGVSLHTGVIRNNMSRMLGGGMYVMGDDPNFTYTVYINKGYVHENKAITAGPKNNPYQDADNQLLSRKITAPSTDCDNPATTIFDGQMTVNSDDLVDGYPKAKNQDGSDGTGGGVWLCAYGSTRLNVADENFVIDKNYATGSILRGKSTETNKVPEGTSSGLAGGNDIHKETKATGNIVILGIDNDDANNVEWYDENTGDRYTTAENAVNHTITDFSLKNLTNMGDNEPTGYVPGSYSGVDVYGNLSRRGGGLAADGTFLFGKSGAIGEAYSELAVTKTWTSGISPTDVTIRISLEYKDGNETKVIPVQELPLSEIIPESSELDTAFNDGTGTDSAGNTVYKGHIILPVSVDDGEGNKIRMFDLVSDEECTIDGDTYVVPYEGPKTLPAGHIFEMETADGLLDLGQYIEQKTGEKVTLSTNNRRLIYEELVDDGNGNLVKAEGFEITPALMKLSTDTPPDIHKEEIFQVNTAGESVPVGYIITSDIMFEAELYNDKESEIEKYINKAVHQDIEVDQSFDYDIIAYVKHGTDKIVITDTLAKDLEFVSQVDDVKVYDVGTKNNHYVSHDITGADVENDEVPTVENTENIITNKNVAIDKNANTLTVTIENALDEVRDANGELLGYKNADSDQNLTEYWGHWVKVSFTAQIKKEIQEKIKTGKMKVSDLESVEIKGSEKYIADPSIFSDDDPPERPEPNVGNDPLNTDEDHAGIPNTASYTLEVKNNAEFKDESNTVTVKPEQPDIPEPEGEKIDIPVQKVWDEEYIGKEKRPTSITVHLYANGEPVGEPLVMSEETGWKGLFEKLDKTDSDGKEIEYTITEDYVDYYYYDTEWLDKTYVVTNHRRPWIPNLPFTPGNVGEIKVQKTVSGAAEKDQAYNITVAFTYKDGSTYTHELFMKPSDEAFVFDYVPAGTKVSVSEKTTGYDMTCKVDGKDATNFTVEIGKTHSVIVNNDKPTKDVTTGDRNNMIGWLVLLTLTAALSLTVAARKKIN